MGKKWETGKIQPRTRCLRKSLKNRRAVFREFSAVPALYFPSFLESHSGSHLAFHLVILQLLSCSSSEDLCTVVAGDSTLPQLGCIKKEVLKRHQKLYKNILF